MSVKRDDGSEAEEVWGPSILSGEYANIRGTLLIAAQRIMAETEPVPPRLLAPDGTKE